jgi:XTP/dITP diphosphohydrolase/ATP diphosphatase
LRDVAEGLSAKLIRRHPHIFSDVVASDSDAVLRNWEQIKRDEKKARGPADSLLDDIPRSMAATLEAGKLGSRAARVGFDWPDADGLFEKIAEETEELRAEVRRGDAARVEAEFGDLLFTMINLARHLKVDPESALRRTNASFRARFAAMEKASGSGLQSKTAAELEELWNQAKAAEAAH